MTYTRPIVPAELVADRGSQASTLPAARPGVVSAAGRLLRQAFVLWREARLARATARDLGRLNDHQLRDIGVARGAIPQVARDAAWAQLAAAGLDSFGVGDRHREF